MKNKISDNDEAPYEMQILNERITRIEEVLLGKGGRCRSLAIGVESSTNTKCSSNLQKGELIYLFHILMEEGIWFFDNIDEKKNRSQFQYFIERHFTYSGEGKVQHNIMGTSRHFSECRGFTYKEKQIRYLDKFIRLLNSKKEKLSRT
ncbi:hypothetical protein [Flavobacterium sp. 7A]|uniref:hypothetical protein n=1 Tax=Flavobacterium sp. 7A TaxID=2940571 RepID=UPI002225F351|nr:hypothetical protein [Flavobacterium sp. 7A]MCW2120643.1 hypothetical protein [Flavobacterium sp. 7A]